jgi:hypothetical protein
MIIAMQSLRIGASQSLDGSTAILSGMVDTFAACAVATKLARVWRTFTFGGTNRGMYSVARIIS